jgi:hypothetical protein
VRLLEAVDFVARTAGGRPWVVNLSIGQTGGPHDGTLPVARSLDELLASTAGAFAVQSVGNYHLARTHASGRLNAGETRTLVFETQPTDLTPTSWRSGTTATTSSSRICIGLTAARVPLGRGAPAQAGGRQVGWIYHRAWDPGNGDHHVDAFLSADAPAGRWLVTMHQLGAGHEPFHAWIERDDLCAGCQSGFVSADTDRRSTPMNGIAEPARTRHRSASLAYIHT